MSLNPLSPTEVLSVARQIHEQMAWQQYVHYMHAIYGSTAYRMEMEVDSEYDDEGGYYNVIRYLRVFDRDGNRLEYDLTTDYFQEMLSQSQAYDWMDEDYYHDQFRDELPVPDSYTTLVTDQPPYPDLPTLYVADGT